MTESAPLFRAISVACDGVNPLKMLLDPIFYRKGKHGVC